MSSFLSFFACLCHFCFTSSLTRYYFRSFVVLMDSYARLGHFNLCHSHTFCDFLLGSSFRCTPLPDLARSFSFCLIHGRFGTSRVFVPWRIFGYSIIASALGFSYSIRLCVTWLRPSLCVAVPGFVHVVTLSPHSGLNHCEQL